MGVLTLDEGGTGGQQLDYSLYINYTAHLYRIKAPVGVGVSDEVASPGTVWM